MKPEKKNIDISITLACYNEVQHIRKSMSELIEFLNNTKLKYELILIDDCSTDGTRDEILRLAKKYKNVRYLFHENNVGRGGTVSEGIMISNGNVAGYIDIDLEIAPWYILPAYFQIKRGYDLAIANRIYKFNLKRIVRWVTTKGYNILMRNMLNMPPLDTEAGLKFFNRRKIIPILKKVENKRWFWDTEIVARSYYDRYNIKQIPVLFVRKNNKASTVRIFRDSLDYLNNLIIFRNKIKKFIRIRNKQRGYKE